MRVEYVELPATAASQRGSSKAYEDMLDREDGRIAAERLAEIHSGQADTAPADEVGRQLGL